MANFFIKQSFLFVTAFCMLSSPLLALAKIHIRQTSTSLASVSGSNAIAVKSSTSSLISNVLYPALRTILSAPIKFIQQLLLDIRQFLGAHNFRDIFNIKFLRMAFTKIPSRLMGYWSSFMEVEMECIRRTFCDMSDYTSPRVPAWLHQILVIYFTTFSQDNVYYQALANGMINHNCPLLYSKCDPQLFMTRMSNNLTNTFNSTVGPLRDAFNELMHVTASTIGHIESTTPIPPAISLDRPQLSNEDETENEEEDNEIVERGHNTFRNGSFRKSDHNPADNDEEDNLLDRSRSNSELNGSQNNNNEEDEDDNDEDQQNNNAGSRLSPKPDNFAPNAVIPSQAHHQKAHHLNNPNNQPINNNRFMTPIVSSQEQFVRTGHHSRQQ